MCLFYFVTNFYLLNIAPFIKELILVKECVILPGFGGFETYYQSARKDFASKVILPPSKKVVFRADMVKDNGILRDFLMQKLKLDQKQADTIISDWINKLKLDLQKTRKVFIEELGTFVLNDKNEVEFKSLEEDHYSAESFGLEKIPIEKKLPPRTEFQKKENKRQEPKKSKSAAWLVLGVAGILAVFFVLIIVFKNEISDKSNILDIFSFLKKDTSEIITFGEDENDEEEEKYDSLIDVKTSTKQALDPFGGKKKITVSKQVQTTSDKYFIVAGSFKKLKNAEILKQSLIEEGFNPYIIELGDFYRVVISSFTDQEEALNELRRIRAQVNKSLWLLSA